MEQVVRFRTDGELKRLIEKQSSSRGITVSNYIRDLVRQDIRHGYTDRQNR